MMLKQFTTISECIYNAVKVRSTRRTSMKKRLGKFVRSAVSKHWSQLAISGHFIAVWRVCGPVGPIQQLPCNGSVTVWWVALMYCEVTVWCPWQGDGHVAIR